jgi:hypothetical protein
MTEGLWDTEEGNAYVTRVRTELVPMIEGSAVGVSIVPTNPEDVDVKFAVELGLMIMMDKPICLVVQPGTEIPERLKRVADEIVMLGDGMGEAIGAFAKKHGVPRET